MGLSLFTLHLLTLPKTQDHPLLSPSVPSALLHTLHYPLSYVLSSMDPSWFGLFKLQIFLIGIVFDREVYM